MRHEGQADGQEGREGKIPGQIYASAGEKLTEKMEKKKNRSS
jgi:hypothetical protein